jgi:hypothetical protein
MMRRGYTTEVRPFRDSDETAEIRWYECHPDAKELGFPSIIRPLDWQSHPYLYAGAKGEVFGAERTYRRNPTVPGAYGQTVCGTRQDFAEGGLYDPDAPPFPRTADGLALCCGTEVGGVLWGGSARLPEFGAGGYLWGGGAFVFDSGLCYNVTSVGPGLSFEMIEDGPFQWVHSSGLPPPHATLTGVPPSWVFVVPEGGAVFGTWSSSSYSGYGTGVLTRQSGEGPDELLIINTGCP